jgi:hypothetical protein
MENASALRNDVSQSRAAKTKAGAAGEKEKAKWVIEIKRAAPVL